MPPQERRKDENSTNSNDDDYLDKSKFKKFTAAEKLGNFSSFFRSVTMDLTVGTWYAMDQIVLLSVRIKPLADI